jgi:MFS family permease
LGADVVSVAPFPPLFFSFPLVVLFLAHLAGRLRPVFVGAIIFIFGGAIQTGCRNREMMLAGRFFAGFAIGMLSMLAPRECRALPPGKEGRRGGKGSDADLETRYAGWLGTVVYQSEIGESGRPPAQKGRKRRGGLTAVFGGGWLNSAPIYPRSIDYSAAGERSGSVVIWDQDQKTGMRALQYHP